MESNKVIHLHLKHPGQDHYFGSVAAIYDVFKAETLGISYNSLSEVLRRGTVYQNKSCIIKRGKMKRKVSNRKNHTNNEQGNN